VSALLQQIVVGVLVGGCALYSAWRLAPVRLRLRTLDVLGALPVTGRARVLLRLRERTLARLASACGGCGHDNSARPAAASPNRTPGALRR
jgi:hypothetical protein